MTVGVKTSEFSSYENCPDLSLEMTIVRLAEELRNTQGKCASQRGIPRLMLYGYPTCYLYTQIHSTKILGTLPAPNFLGVVWNCFVFAFHLAERALHLIFQARRGRAGMR
jgi:hypothetical protein